MKRWLISILVLLLLIIGAIYVFIPNYISVTEKISVIANKDGLHRKLFDESNWKNWWPGKTEPIDGDSTVLFTYNDNTYSIKEKGNAAFLISVQEKSFKTVTTLTIIATKTDSTILAWEASIPTSYNPLSRLQIYFKARQLGQDMKIILEKMRVFFSQSQNVYSSDILKAKVSDSTLVSTSGQSQGYPTIGFIYGLIDQLKKYIASASAQESGFPMLHISTNDSVIFTTRVAIPVNKKLPSSGNISYKGMLYGGNILIAEVKGGQAAAEKALLDIEEYVRDHHRMAPAIHFFSLVTDRRLEPDSSRWITRVCYPVR